MEDDGSELSSSDEIPELLSDSEDGDSFETEPDVSGSQAAPNTSDNFREADQDAASLLDFLDQGNLADLLESDVSGADLPDFPKNCTSELAAAVSDSLSQVSTNLYNVSCSNIGCALPLVVTDRCKV